MVMSAIGLAAAYIALIAFDAIKSIEAFATLMLVTVTPWMVIMTIGHLMRHGWYEPMDLQAFADRAKTGVYWFTGGFNVKAFIAWGAAVAVGTLFTSTSIITGPLTGHVSGIDLSFTSAAMVGGVLYYALVKIFPERGVTARCVAGPGSDTSRRGCDRVGKLDRRLVRRIRAAAVESALAPPRRARRRLTRGSRSGRGRRSVASMGTSAGAADAAAVPSLWPWILVAAALIAAEKLVVYPFGGEHRAARP